MGRLVVEAAENLIGKYFPVHNHGFIALRNYMGGDLEIERFARGSYEIEPKIRTVKETETLLRYLFRHEHTSPFESVEFSFHLGMPIFVGRQWIRHRMSSTNEISGRYTELPPLFYSPAQDEVCLQSMNNKQGSGDMVGFEEFLDFLEFHEGFIKYASEHYNGYLEDGIAKEMARIDLPLSTYTYFNWKIDLHNLFRFLHLRCKPNAQRQIRDYADVIAGIVKEVCPLSFSAWYDYQYEGVRLSRMEINTIRNLIWSFADDADLKEWIYQQGVDNKREQNEFVEKLQFKSLKRFDLNMSVAKTPDFFMDKINNALKAP